MTNFRKVDFLFMWQCHRRTHTLMSHSSHWILKQIHDKFQTLPNMFAQVDEDYMEALTNHELL